MKLDKSETFCAGESFKLLKESYLKIFRNWIKVKILTKTLYLWKVFENLLENEELFTLFVKRISCFLYSCCFQYNRVFQISTTFTQRNKYQKNYSAYGSEILSAY